MSEHLHERHPVAGPVVHDGPGHRYGDPFWCGGCWWEMEGKYRPPLGRRDRHADDCTGCAADRKAAEERELLLGNSSIAAPAAYPPYDPDLICPKCGHEDVATAWHHGHHIWTGFGVTVGRWDMYGDCLDWLLRTCECCGYAWPEAPIDQDDRQATS